MSWGERRGPQLLVAEDDPAVLELLSTRLELAGYSLTYARDGAEALSRLREGRPAAVLLDIGMPVMDGWEVLAALRRSETLKEVPVMVITARNSPEDVKKAIGLGARDFLAKPFDDRQLAARVARLVRGRRAA